MAQGRGVGGLVGKGEGKRVESDEKLMPEKKMCKKVCLSVPRSICPTYTRWVGKGEQW